MADAASNPAKFLRLLLAAHVSFTAVGGATRVRFGAEHELTHQYHVRKTQQQTLATGGWTQWLKPLRVIFWCAAVSYGSHFFKQNVWGKTLPNNFPSPPPPPDPVELLHFGTVGGA